MLPFFFFALLMVFVYFIRIQQSLIRKLYFLLLLDMENHA